VNSAIHYYTAAQRNDDAIREARRAPRPGRAFREPAARPGLAAVLARRLTRPPDALRAVFHRS
jgi:hypothetical protein